MIWGPANTGPLFLFPREQFEYHRGVLKLPKAARRQREFVYMLRWRGWPLPTRPRPKRCDCCGRKKPAGRGGLHYDHCHKTNTFRGWLCHHCNVGLGHLGDNLTGLMRAVRYLKRSRKPKR